MSKTYWEDIPVSRIPSLYSDFAKLKDLNPEGYEANVLFWQSLIMTKVKSLTFKPNDVLASLSIEKYGTPKTLDIPIDRLIEKNLLATLSQFESPDSSLISTLKWALSRTVIDLSFKSRNGNNNSNYLKNVELVHMENLRMLALKCMSVYKEKCLKNSTKELDLVYTVEALHQLVFDKVSSEREHILILQYLSKYEKTLVVESNVVKFYKTGIAQSKEKISETEQGMAEIKWGLSRLDLELDKVLQHLREYQVKIRNSAKAKEKELLKSYLKAKKKMEMNRDRYISQREKLEEIKNDIEVAFQNKVMYDVLEVSSKVLSSLNKEIESIEAVDKLLGEIEEQKQFTEEISKVMTLSNSQEYEIDEELETMLADLRKEEEEEEEEEEHQKQDASTKVEKVDKKSSNTPETSNVLDKLEKLTIKDESSSHSSNNVENEKHVENGDPSPEKVPQLAT